MTIASAPADPITDDETGDPTTQFRQACALVIENRKASTSWLQRQLRIGYNNAASLIERMEAVGLISKPNEVGARTVLATADVPISDVAMDDAIPIAAECAVAMKAAPKNSPADRLRLLIERIERLEEEKRGIGDDIKDVYLEAKSTGYDVKGIRTVVAMRKMARDARLEQEAIVETYKCALGID